MAQHTSFSTLDTTYAIATYRYLRLGMMLTLALIALAVLVERAGAGCFQTSISAYYYTPASPVFVAGLVTIGMGMVVLKGSTEWEDILLNLAGMLAPVVAFVPTPGEGTCFSTPGTRPNIEANVANNVPVLVVGGVIGVVALLVVRALVRRDGGYVPHVSHTIGVVVSVAVLVAGFGWFLLARTSFVGNAHNVSAISLFACIVAVVWLNGRGYGDQQVREGHDRPAPYRNTYFLIAVLMIASFAVLYAVGRLTGSAHTVLWIEAALLVFFFWFWALQTWELWHDTIRDGAAVG